MAAKKKICLACDPSKSEHNIQNFYSSKNPLHKDGLIPWCKECIKKNSLNTDGTLDEEKIMAVLRQVDKPYYKDTLQSAINQFKKEHPSVPDENVSLYGGDILGLYFKNINTLRQLQAKTYADSLMDNFIRSNGSNTKLEEITKSNITSRKQEVKHYTEVGDFVVTEEIRELFGDGYSTTEYKKMIDKYEKLKLNYTMQTNLHQEALVTYVRFKVKEEEATSNGNVEEAKKWYDAAVNAADKAKLTPKQLTKADLQGGVNSISELTKALEQAVDVVKILPQFKYRPNDAPDFTIYCYVNYERELNGQPQVDYSQIYSFYDRKKKEYLEQNGDPYGIFSGDTTEKNRPNVKTFIKLPDDYDDLAGDKNGD